ncbi:gluconate 5-dehydrogenase [Neorhizobium sp. R1-B]|jgi:NAD(P)-dependent dehydrogenase (short-subunit alcohol dehydrogenase family)|uniref:SDR family oxidoreductase n=1 Tax=Neorhizobium TaxID=1525371 RepID=UPI000CFA546B|nr:MULTISPECIES: SDR family oxidoreductase [Neorhizobium]TDX79556.1 gluconate 5-dehydrogenase [Neorhizobium sp. R1-B]
MHEDVERLFDLSGRTALVTGGSSNLGWAASGILAAAGASVAISSRSLARAEKAAERLASRYGGESLALEIDHSHPASIESARDRLLSWRGSLDILVNNAGGGSGSSIARLFERDPKDMRTMLESNLLGPLLCCQVFAEPMVDRGRGKIINLGSIAGIVGRDRRVYEDTDMLGQPVDYAAAKGGIIAMTRDLAGYLGPMGVNVNAISPGGFERGQHAKFVAGYRDLTPLGRMGREPDDLTGAVLFLASAGSDYVHGHNLVVDGGFSVWK